MSGRRPNCCLIAFRLTSWIHCPIQSVFIPRLRKLITAVEGHCHSFSLYETVEPVKAEQKLRTLGFRRNVSQPLCHHRRLSQQLLDALLEPQQLRFNDKGIWEDGWEEFRRHTHRQE